MSLHRLRVEARRRHQRVFPRNRVEPPVPVSATVMLSEGNADRTHRLPFPSQIGSQTSPRIACHNNPPLISNSSSRTTTHLKSLISTLKSQLRIFLQGDRTRSACAAESCLQAETGQHPGLQGKPNDEDTRRDKEFHNVTSFVSCYRSYFPGPRLSGLRHKLPVQRCSNPRLRLKVAVAFPLLADDLDCPSWDGGHACQQFVFRN